jgi:hypothetical protein
VWGFFFSGSNGGVLAAVSLSFYLSFSTVLSVVVRGELLNFTLLSTNRVVFCALTVHAPLFLFEFFFSEAQFSAPRFLLA